MELATLLNYVGMAGALFYLSSYFLLQAGFIGGNSNTYTILNLIAATLVLFSLYTAFNVASLIIQVSWITISIYGMARMFFINRRLRFTKEERDFLDVKLPHLRKHLARQVLNKGIWIEGKAGTQLTTQGVSNDHLIYLSQGKAQVILNKRLVAEVASQSYIGEMTLLNQDVATATVQLSSDARYLCFDAAAIRSLCKQHGQVAQAIESSFASDMRSKLEASNIATRPPSDPTDVAVDQEKAHTPSVAG